MANNYKKCTRCGQTFPSEGRFSNNLCPDCVRRSSGSTSQKNAGIKYIIFVAAILLFGLIKLIIDNKELFIIIGIILVFVIVLSIVFYRKAKKKKVTQQFEQEQSERNVNTSEE